ncbi:shufflon system plasmid conjugative transfer pilus tip adhesin PilV [Pantoea ananatis]|uniref:shufflon system plasmid conjugative transfer pilus tip adhesin PilV n=1 Tax=Pantoea ananas TaxID=553 RepID=UPI000FEC4A37|nr:shufflon system plasmid conjugative transfer pilus tip adhesin PilV [Pantoea ananatis]QAB32648.1 shufflon system plasmid conjugative transfer pilus tip adhesin PilV [Pantoea ananatis]
MKFLRRKPRTVHRGNMLLQLIMVLAIVLMVLPGSMDRYAENQQEKVWTGVASHLSFVAQAGKRYIRDNRDTLLNQVGSGPVTISGATLKAQGYLPAGFSLTNDSGQAYQLAIAKDPGQAGQLVAFVLTTGGNDIPYKGLRQIAADSEGMGGYIWPSNMAIGADGGWQARLTDYGLSAQQGRLAAFLSADALGTDADESDRLYRYQVNGRPDLNRMHTAIDMNGNNINNGGTVNAATGAFTGDVNAGNNVNASNGITANNDIRSNNGWVITRGGKGWLNETYGGGFYMSDNDWVRSVNNKNIYTGGQIRGNYLSSEANINVGGQLELNQVNSPDTWCPRNGNISRDGSGGLLNCKDNKWQGVKSNGQYNGIGYFTGQYNGYNSSSYTLTVYATGGQSTVHKQINDGDCSNTMDLQGWAGGVPVASMTNNNVGWAKSGFITFQVPANTGYQVVSNPLAMYGCNPGTFNLYTYQ